MKLFCPAIKDTYITNKKFNANFDASNSNVGQAGTLDLFKISNESEIEFSRLLLKFDFAELKSLISDQIDLNDDSFQAHIKLFDVKSGHRVPENYSLIALPLFKSFDEGKGIDVSGFVDKGVANFLTSSFEEEEFVSWNEPGALDFGSLESNPDAVEFYEIDDDLINVAGSTFVSQGHSDVSIDITNAVSGILSNDIPDCGFLIAFSGSYETDNVNRFVKRFASRHNSNPQLRPRIEISYDDSIQDHHADFRFDVANNLYFINESRDGSANFIQDSNLTQVQGDNCLYLTLTLGSFQETYPVSQMVRGTEKIPIPGMYVAKNVVIPSFSEFISGSSEVSGTFTFNDYNKRIEEFKFEERLLSLDFIDSYHECCLVVKSNKSCKNNNIKHLIINSTNLLGSYNSNQLQKINVFVDDASKTMKSRRTTSLKKKSEVFGEMHYRLVDAINGNLIFDFDFEKKSTRMSYDLEGMYFDFRFNIVPRGKPHYFEFAIRDSKETKIFKDPTNFVVVD